MVGDPTIVTENIYFRYKFNAAEAVSFPRLIDVDQELNMPRP
jgi:hypothetical protein